MNVVRGLERRLERLLEGVAGRAFAGKLHPSEIASKLAREADFARFDHPAGPATANSFTLTFNPHDLTADSRQLETTLSAEMEAHMADLGLRVEGPAQVRVETSERVKQGSVLCHVEVVPGPLVVWARLVSDGAALPLGRNRVLIGRAPEMDVIIDDDDVSRRHALLWREGGANLARDLGSSNGTFVDGVRIGDDPVNLGHGSQVAISQHHYRFLTGDA